MSELESWTGSVIEKLMLANEVGRFLRTHRDGHRLLLEYLESVPPDRTEEELRAVVTSLKAQHADYIAQTLEKINADRVARGLYPVGKISDLDDPPLSLPPSDTKQ
jgi:hypothetical protein